MTREKQVLHGKLMYQIIPVQFSHSVVSSSLRPHRLQHTRPPCPSPTPRVYSKLKSIESVMPSNDLVLCHPLPLLPSIFPSNRVFSSESVLQIRWPNYWSFSFSISLSNEFSRLISFRMDQLDLLAVQGPFKSLLQHHSSKASILQHSAETHMCLLTLNLKKNIYKKQCQSLQSQTFSSMFRKQSKPDNWVKFIYMYTHI